MSVSRILASTGTLTSILCRAAASSFLILTPNLLMVSASSARYSLYSSTVSRNTFVSRAIVAESICILFIQESSAVLFIWKRSRSSVRYTACLCCSQTIPPRRRRAVDNIPFNLFIRYGFFGDEPQEFIHISFFQQYKTAIIRLSVL